MVSKIISSSLALAIIGCGIAPPAQAAPFSKAEDRTVKQAVRIPPAKPNYSSPTKLAISLSFPMYGSGEHFGKSSHPAAYTGGGVLDRSRVHPSYQSARVRASALARVTANPSMPATSKYWANCSAFTATVINNTLDAEFPANLVKNQYKYISKPSNGWVKVGDTARYNPSSYRAGDIFITTDSGRITSGHTFMWVGKHAGLNEVVAEAAYGGDGSSYARMPALHVNRQKTSKDQFGRKYEVWRFVGKKKNPNGSTDYTGDTKADLYSVDNRGNLRLHASNSKGGLSAGTKVSAGWKNRTVIQAGDVTGDRKSDIFAVEKGYLYLYPGRGGGKLGSKVLVGSGFDSMRSLTSPGDINGDGLADLVGIRKIDGKLITWTLNKYGKVSAKKTAGTGWKSWEISSGSDLSGDRKADLLAVEKRTGKLYLYRGNGRGGYGKSSRVLLSKSGWSSSTAVSHGDLNGDGKADLVSHKSGKTYLHKGLKGGKLGARTALKLPENLSQLG